MRKKWAANNSEQALALLAALSNDLALPLLQVKTSLEVWAGENYDKKQLTETAEKMSLSVDSGLQLIEAYRLTLKANDNLTLDYQPVAIGAVLNDVAHHLSAY